MKKKILITGNLGYLGPNVTKYFKQRGYVVYGQDLGLFDEDILSPLESIERPHFQSYRDVRDGLSYDDVLFDTVLYLAAVSNDPIGDTYESATFEINHKAAVRCYNEANSRGVNKFIYASSCSVYGFNEEPVNESSPLFPLTSYAKSKISAEIDLNSSVDKTKIICFRFATACGLSKRLRLDLVLNDFVINAINTGRIDILSDGKPKRPLIDVEDMAKSFFWASEYNIEQNFEVFNCGSTFNNYSVLQLAEKVNEAFKGELCITYNPDYKGDSRSYCVDFSKFENVYNGEKFHDIEFSIQRLIYILRKGSIENFRKSNFIRYNKLANLLHDQIINQNLRLK